MKKARLAGGPDRPRVWRFLSKRLTDGERRFHGNWWAKPRNWRGSLKQKSWVLCLEACRAVAEEAIAYGCDEVHVLDDPLLSRYLSATYGKALSDLCVKLRPAILLIGATPLGRDLAGVVATRLQTGLTADCTGLYIDKETGLLLMTRPTFGGNIMATIFCQRHRPQMSSVRPRVFRMPEKDPGRKGVVRRHELEAPAAGLPEIVKFIPAGEQASADIVRYPALVVAGRGACDPVFDASSR